MLKIFLFFICKFVEDGFETSSVSGKYSTTVYDNLRCGNTTSLIENLQAQLKMRDGWFAN